MPCGNPAMVTGTLVFCKRSSFPILSYKTFILYYTKSYNKLLYFLSFSSIIHIMKVAIYQNIGASTSPEKFEAYNALKRRTDIEEITFLAPNTLKMMIRDSKISFNISGIDIVEGRFDILILRGGFGNMPNAIEFLKYCRKIGIKVFDNNLEKIRYMINKRSDYIKLANAGISIPDTYVFSDILDMNKSNLEFPLVMKTTNTGKGMNVEKVHNIEEVEQILLNKDKKLSDYIFQKIIDYEHDLRVLVVGEEVVGVMKRIPKPGDFRANFSLGGSVEPFEVNSEIRDIAINAAKACDLMVSGVDVLVDKSGKLWVLEANRTPGLEGITQALGNEISDKVVDFMLNNAK